MLDRAVRKVLGNRSKTEKAERLLVNVLDPWMNTMTAKDVWSSSHWLTDILNRINARYREEIANA